MYGMNYSGGANKTHGQIERAYRIDSFEAGTVEDRGIVFASSGGKILPLHCDRCGLDGRELVELSYPGSRWRDTLKLARVRSGYGGNRAFWLCPICGRQARFLYFKNHSFVCRECARLNYRSQQRTRSSLNHEGGQEAMTNEELTQAVQELQAHPLVLLCRTPAGQVRRMSLQECVRTGSAYIQLVWDDLNQLLCTELGEGGKI